MSLADLDAHTMQFIARSDVGVKVRYTRGASGYCYPELPVFVHEISEEDPGGLRIGRTAVGGKRPLVLRISTTDLVDAPDEQNDTLIYNGKEYTVAVLLDEEPGAWKVYCE